MDPNVALVLFVILCFGLSLYCTAANRKKKTAADESIRIARASNKRDRENLIRGIPHPFDD